MSSSSISERKYPSLPYVVAIFTLSRTTIDTAARMVYPLLPVFAREVEVGVGAIVSILALVQLMGLVSPFIGMTSERRGRKFTVLVGLLCFMVGTLAVFISPNFVGLSVALLIGAFGKYAFGPAAQAYIGDRVPYARRGRYLGIIELAWSGAFLFGVPAMTWLIATFNWQAPFAALAILSAVGAAAAWVLLEPDQPAAVHHVAFLSALRAAVQSPMALAGLCLGFTISAANQLVSVVFGTWIEASFGIQLAVLAVAAAVIGVAELKGESIVALLSDRVGKRRLVLYGVGGNILACLILPLTDISLAAALAGLFFFYLTFELSVVASIPLASELSPQSRAMYLTVLVTAITLGRALFTPVAPALYASGLFANCLVAAGLNLLAFAVVWKFISVK